MKNKEQCIGELLEEYFGCDPAYYSKQEVEEITRALEIGFNFAEELSKPKWVTVSEQTPPKNIDLLAKSPEGLVHITNWREAYDIFTVQTKDESSFDWEWMQIPE